MTRAWFHRDVAPGDAFGMSLTPPGTKDRSA